MKTMTPLPDGLVIFLATEVLVPTIAWDIPKSGLASQPRIEDVKQRPRLCPPSASTTTVLELLTIFRLDDCMQPAEPDLAWIKRF